MCLEPGMRSAKHALYMPICTSHNTPHPHYTLHSTCTAAWLALFHAHIF
jgi:hypothetical protein